MGQWLARNLNLRGPRPLASAAMARPRRAEASRPQDRGALKADSEASRGASVPAAAALAGLKSAPRPRRTEISCTSSVPPRGPRVSVHLECHQHVRPRRLDLAFPLRTATVRENVQFTEISSLRAPVNFLGQRVVSRCHDFFLICSPPI
jgi:hypothetical protein